MSKYIVGIQGPSPGTMRGYSRTTPDIYIQDKHTITADSNIEAKHIYTKRYGIKSYLLVAHKVK